MRIRQMAFSSKLKAHKDILTLETLKFISEYLVDQNAKQAALRIGIPETYASRYGQWLKKRPQVVAALECEFDKNEMRQFKKALREIETQMAFCKNLLGLDQIN